MHAMTYLSTFSGIGGFELGIGAALPGSRCIGFSEIDPKAISVYQRHFKGVRNYGDISSIQTTRLPHFDALVGGFPCQAFSTAGKRGGFDDTRGTLFFEIARLLRARQPRLLVLENVKGLLAHDGGATFATILGVLADLGYFVEWQALDSKDFGVPQSRERVYLVGHRGGPPRRTVFPLLPGSHTPAGDDADRERLFTVAAQRGRRDADGGMRQRLEARSDGLTNALTTVQKDNILLIGHLDEQMTGPDTTRTVARSATPIATGCAATPSPPTSSAPSSRTSRQTHKTQ